MTVRYLFVVTFLTFSISLLAQTMSEYYQKGIDNYGTSPDSSIYYFDLCAKKGYELKRDSDTISSCIHNIGIVLRDKKNMIYQSIIFLDSARVIRLNYENRQELVAKSYFNVGESYYLLGDYDAAIDYYKEAVKIAKNTDRTLHFKALKNLGGIYLNKQDYQEALRYFNECERLYQEDSQLSKIYINKGYAYDGLKDYEKAIKFYEKASDRCNNSCEDLSKIYNNLSISNRKMGNYAIAKKYIYRAIEAEGGNVMSDYDNNLGDIFFDENNFDSALYYHRKAIVKEEPKFEKLLLGEVQISDKGIIHSGDKLNVLIYLSSLAHTYYALGEKEKSHFIYRLCQTEINSILEDVANPESKLGLIQRSNELFDRAINVAYEIEDYRTAFTLSEQRKAVMLMDNLLQIDKQKYSGVPSKLLDSLLYLKKNSSDKTELYEFENSIKKTYPKYAEVSQQSRRIDIDEIKRDLIGEKSVLIEFFISKNFIYVFKIDKDGVEVERIENQISNNIQKLNEIITNRNMRRTEYIDSARNIYETLLYNVLNDVASNTQLIIIPDGILYKTPFDALLVSDPDGDFFDLGSMDYLIEHYPITYGYSASVLLQNNKSNTKNNGKGNTMLALAPVFESSDDIIYCSDTLSPLALNISEAREAIKYFDGKMDDGTHKFSFLNQARNADYILFSTHAFASADDDSKNKIYLNKDSCLLMNDIQYEQFQAQMVVLSACETGKGRNEVGEGVLSFARSFAYAGVPSVTMNLWEADDETSSKIIPMYFKYIKKGYSKSEALRKAKLNYIKAKPNNTPYMWASLAHIGNPQPTFNTRDFNLWWLLIAVVILTLLWLLKNRFS